MLFVAFTFFFSNKKNENPLDIVGQPKESEREKETLHHYNYNNLL